MNSSNEMDLNFCISMMLHIKYYVDTYHCKGVSIYSIALKFVLYVHTYVHRNALRHAFCVMAVEGCEQRSRVSVHILPHVHYTYI